VRQRLVLTPKFDTIKAKGELALRYNIIIEQKVKPILEANTVLPDYRLPYYAYARALDKSQRTMPYIVDRIREHGILRERFEGYGLLAAILDLIDAVVIYNTTNPPL
jgi:DNA-binding transcriptional ArsR family regulator